MPISVSGKRINSLLTGYIAYLFSLFFLGIFYKTGSFQIGVYFKKYQ